MDYLQMAFWFVVSLVVMAEALNKMERTKLLFIQASWRERVQLALKALGWACMGLGAAGNVVAGFIPRDYVEFGYSLMVAGCAMFVVRARLRETPAGQEPIESDDFNRTQVLRRPMR